ncbi:MAG TPA: hypothetical protein DD735_10050 [Clostridiales bacterium]|nr:hypothetical protein [Clostridiales bacterium]
MHEGHHSCDHEHSGDSPEMRRALLEYLLGHNRSHARELQELGEKFEKAGSTETAAAVRESAACFGRGNAALERALAALKGD